jgi:hypothetical protein
MSRKHSRSRRDFLKASAATAAIASFVPFIDSPLRAEVMLKPLHNGMPIPDEGWRMGTDTEALWKEDEIFLPSDVNLAKLPVNPPTGGWSALTGTAGLEVKLPATVEQYHWGKFGLRSYADGEYYYATNEKSRTRGTIDEVPQNGAYRGVSWFYREIEIPADFAGQSIWLHLRGVRQRAEIYLNQKLVGYTILEELPYDCEITAAAKPGERNLLAIRITNPGGRYDWVDGDSLTWGKVSFQKSHGFGGVDRGLSLTSHKGLRISDAWVLNTDQPRRVKLFAEVVNLTKETLKTYVDFYFPDVDTFLPYTSGVKVEVELAAGESKRVSAEFEANTKSTTEFARLWSVESPNLYTLRVVASAYKSKSRPTDSADALCQDERTLRFGFRSFTVEGLGTNAMFRLNGERTRLYSAISWGYWPLNGLFPTPEFAEKEVDAAKLLGLNCLNFHRNPGKQDVLDNQDKLGLMRWMEPGGGAKAANKPKDEKTAFDQRYEQEKILHMIRAFRSHPSVMGWTLQNEGKTELTPELFAILKKMHEEDPSRCVVANDGFTMRSHQAWYLPWSDKLLTSPLPNEPQPKDLTINSAGGWWNDHQAAGSDVWLDKHWKSPREYQWRSENKGEIVEWGEMEGSAMLDNHASVLREIAHHGGKSYDLLDHQEIDAGYAAFLKHSGFAAAFPTTEVLYRELGRRCYKTWQQYMENARICDVNDYLSISGWESTSIENHSGIVDVFRDFKASPQIIAESLLPVRPVAKQRAMVWERGDKAVFDIYLLNETSKSITGTVDFAMIAPSGARTSLGSWPVPARQQDVFSYLVQEALQTPPLTEEGWYRFILRISGTAPGSPKGANVPFGRELWVTSTKRNSAKQIRVGVIGEAADLAKALGEISGVTAEAYRPDTDYNLLAFSQDLPAKARVETTDGMGSYVRTDDASALSLPPEVIAQIRKGTPALGVASTTAASISIGKQFAAEGAFKFNGMVGLSRAPWMGAWYFNREHALFHGMPQNCVLGVEYQVRGNSADGWLVEGDGVEVVTGYSRDHDRKVGAGTLVTKLGAGRVVLHRVPTMQAVLQRRFLLNVVEYLTV